MAACMEYGSCVVITTLPLFFSCPHCREPLADLGTNQNMFLSQQQQQQLQHWRQHQRVQEQLPRHQLIFNGERKWVWYTNQWHEKLQPLSLSLLYALSVWKIFNYNNISRLALYFSVGQFPCRAIVLNENSYLTMGGSCRQFSTGSFHIYSQKSNGNPWPGYCGGRVSPEVGK